MEKKNDNKWDSVLARAMKSGRGMTLAIIQCVFLGLDLNTVNASEVGRGGQAGSFMRMGIGARAMAMGGGSSALADDATAGYYNPAGLAFLKGRQVGFTLNTMALDRTLSHLAYAQSFGSEADSTRSKRPMQAGFSFAWLGAGVDDIDGRDFDGNHTRTYCNWENAFYFSFAIKPGPALAVGFSAKLLWSTFPRLTDDGKAVSANGLGFDLGAMLKPIPSLTLGASIHDLRSRYTWDSQKLYERGSQTTARFPLGFSAGAAWLGFSGRVLATARLDQYKTIRDDGSRYLPAEFGLGVQAEPLPGLFLRAGLRDGDLTFGGGYSRTVFSKRTELDYAFVPDPVAPRGNHMFSWSFVF